jgi:pimeloyl-ACP methyl ester carboxylesterase
MLQFPFPDSVVDVSLPDGERIVLRRYANRGKPAVALSHGNGFAINAYAPFWAPMVRDFDLFIFDMRHHGLNAPQDTARTGFNQFAEDLDHVYKFIREQAPGVPLVTGHHSLSAIATIVQAAKFDEAPDALILFDPPLQPPVGHRHHDFARALEMKLAAWSKDRPAGFEAPEVLAAQFGKSRSLSGWIEGAHLLMAQSTLREDNGEWVLCCPPAVESQTYLDNANLNSWELLLSLDLPYAMIAADPSHPAGQSPALSCQIIADDHGIRRIWIPGTTHMLQIEQPDACREAYVTLMEELL